MDRSYLDRLLILHETSCESIKYRLSSANLPTNGNKQVLYERYLGHWLEKKERENGINEAQKRYQEAERIKELTDEHKDREQPLWKQCKECQKWRALPHDLLMEKLPEHWTCSMNTFDEEHNSCEKSEAGLPPRDDEGETVVAREDTDKGTETDHLGDDNNYTWVQCDDCNKWRALPQDSVVEDLPDRWTCALNTDRDRDSCDKSEVDHDDFTHSADEEEDEEVDEYGFTESYKQEVLKKFKEYKVELEEKKRARAERDEELAKERTQRMMSKQEEIFQVWANKATSFDKAARRRAANRANATGRLPISTYPYELDEAKAFQQLLRDLHCGVDVNAEDNNGLTAIYHAHMNHFEGYVQQLLAAGAIDDELHLENDDYFMSLENPRRGKKPRDEWGLDKFL